MEKFPEISRAPQEAELPPHPPLPELQLPTPLPEIDKSKNISPELLDDLIKKLPDDPADDVPEKISPTIH